MSNQPPYEPSNVSVDEQEAMIRREHNGESRLLPITNLWQRLPYWLLAAILLGLIITWSILTSPDYQVIYQALVNGIVTTLYVTAIAFAAAILWGLIVGLARVSKNPAIYHAASFYVEIVRGVPLLVLLYYVSFVVVPGAVNGVNSLGTWLIERHLLTVLATPLAELSARTTGFTFRAIVALTLGYGAFISEIFRAGIESIEKGQMEAARALGMSYPQAMIHVILPQAIRRVLPPLGNDFIAMLKDSSLVSVLGVQDITQLGKVYAASTFRFFETYNVVAFLYLVMTIVLSLVVQYIERRTEAGLGQAA
jgi:polar amino acid transport system permease protein